jgi:hypothetical protein
MSMMYRETTAIYSQNHTDTPMFSVGKMQRFSNLGKEVYIITIKLEGFHIRLQQPD